MALDVKTLLAVNVVNLFFMALTLTVIMGRQLSPAATYARASLVVHALGWTGFIVTNALGEHWRMIIPAGMLQAYQSYGLWLLPTFSVACSSVSMWLLFAALRGWLGPRRGGWLMVGLVFLTPLGYALSYASYPVRVGWSNASLACQLLLVCGATLRPASGLGGYWRWVIFACTLVMTGLTIARGVLGAFYTDLYPSFGSPHPVNIMALMATNVALVLTCLAVMVAWREEADAKLREQAFTDGLTGLLNRHGWNARAPALFDQSRRHGTPLALLMLDLDKFKDINDTLGHEVGDRVLRLFGDVLSVYRRSSDLAARVGGEEFALLLPHTDQAAAMLIEQRLRAALKVACTPEPQMRVDYSAGLAMLNPDDTTLTAFMVRADNALYRAKDAGRGRLQIA